MSPGSSLLAVVVLFISPCVYLAQPVVMTLSHDQYDARGWDYSREPHGLEQKTKAVEKHPRWDCWSQIREILLGLVTDEEESLGMSVHR